MKYFCFILIMLTAISGNMLIAQDFDVKYLMQSESGELSLIFENKKDGNYSGILAAEGITYILQGSIQDGLLSGTVGDELDAIIFEAELNTDGLTLVLVETDEFNQPILETAQILLFQRQSVGDELANQPKTDSKEVMINDTVLSKEQIEELIETYGIEPLPGDYWYDTKSGLYGVVGYPAYGYMYAGHDFGSLRRDVSQGNTNVVVNGRELPQTEWAVWSYILGYWIQAGNYWFDDQGNAGYEGNPLPLVNLFVAAQQNTYQGRGGSGDNFWSTRFSAGNYDSGNQRGYVSVPGHGPIGYGF
ncbi:hypothetical protein ACFLS9_03345 [Bacteroidota bacterium]